MSKKNKTPQAFVLLKVQQNGDKYKYYLMTEGTSALGFLDVADGLRYFEGSYKQAVHGGSVQQSTSAVIHMMQFNPSVVALTNMEDLEKLVTLPAHVMRLNSVAGSLTGIECKPEAKKVWESGQKPGI